MSITVVPSAITGQTLSAANWNTQVRDNINGMWVLTTAGDMLFATGASAAARLALVPGGVMYGGASAPDWLPLVTGGVMYGGASAPAFTSPGGINAVLKSNGAYGVNFGAILHHRLGGSATAWTIPGGTGYTPEGLAMQSGYTNCTVAGTGGSVAITYPARFGHRPHIILSVELSISTPYVWGLGHSDDSEDGFTAHIKFSGSISVTCAIGWLAFTDY